jgi:predicted ester cyclase
MDDAKAVLRAMVAMFSTGDASDAESVVAAGYVDHQDGGRGPEGFRTLVTRVHATGALDVRVEDLIGEEDRAAARLTWRHTNADGSVVERETIEMVRCESGQAVEHWGAEISRRNEGRDH